MFTLTLIVRKAIQCEKITRSSSSLSYCVNLVKKLDYENYLCTLLLPDRLKASAFAIRAFNIEIAKVQEQVTEEHIMPLRFKFWDDSLNNIYNDKTVNHPVLIELHKAIKKHDLSKMFLKRLLSVRAKQLNNPTFKDVAEMEMYADQSTTPVYMLLLEVSGVKNINCDHVASHLGTAQGIANLVRGLPYNIKEQLIMMPMSLLMKYKVSEESILRMSVDMDALHNIVFDVAAASYKHLKLARSMQEQIPLEHRILFLPAVAVSVFLERLEKYGFNLYHRKMGFRNGLLPLQLYIYKLKKMF